MVEVADGFEIGTEFEYKIDGEYLQMTITDVYLVSGDADEETLAMLEEYREEMVGFEQRVPYYPIEDGYFIGGDNYTKV